MPTFVDIHPDLQGVTPEQALAAHHRDLEVQGKFGVRYLTFWLNDSEGRAFCLVEAPSKEAAIAVHREAHGLIPDNILEVEPLRATTVSSYQTRRCWTASTMAAFAPSCSPI
jgi:hypothetical protein